MSSLILDSVHRELNYLSISGESFKDTLARIIKVIIEKINSLIDTLTDVSHYNLPLFNLKNRIEDLITETNVTGIKGSNVSFPVNANFRFQAINQKPITDVKSLRLGLNNLIETTQVFFNYKVNLMEAKEEYFDHRDSFINRKQFIFNDNKALSIHLLGNKQFQVASTVTLINSNNQPLIVDNPNNYSFQRMSSQNQIGLLQTLKRNVEILTKHYTGKNRNDLVNILKSIRVELKSLKKDSPETRKRVDELNQYTNQLNNLELDVFKLNVNVIKHCLKLVEDNLTIKE